MPPMTQDALFEPPPRIEGGWHGDATYSPCQQYRYTLTRIWGRAVADGGQLLPFLMLNPSTATEHVLDPTLRRCKGFATRLGYDGMVILNLFAYRATDPRVMKAQADPVGPDNDAAIVTACTGAPFVIAAWGTHGTHQGRDAAVHELLAATGVPLKRLGEPSRQGHPRHPLYLPGDSPLVSHPGPARP